MTESSHADPALTPWSLHPALTAERLAVAARLLMRGRRDAVALADPWAGDDAWSIGCRAYAFSKSQVRRAAESGHHPWLKVLDDTNHFVFLIDRVPVRFYRGPADEPTRRTLRQQEVEAAQLSLAFEGDSGAAELMFRFAVETDAAGNVSRIVFLALRGEEGQVVTCWPVPFDDTRAGERRGNSGAVLQLPLPAARRDGRPSRSVSNRAR